MYTIAFYRVVLCVYREKPRRGGGASRNQTVRILLHGCLHALLQSICKLQINSTIAATARLRMSCFVAAFICCLLVQEPAPKTIWSGIILLCINSCTPAWILLVSSFSSPPTARPCSNQTATEQKPQFLPRLRIWLLLCPPGWRSKERLCFLQPFWRPGGLAVCIEILLPQYCAVLQ
jgi:hypothetical protein